MKKIKTLFILTLITTFFISCSSDDPFTDRYQPEGSLASLNGKPSTGNWSLKVYDDDGGDAGTLDNWSIELCGQ